MGRNDRREFGKMEEGSPGHVFVCVCGVVLIWARWQWQWPKVPHLRLTHTPPSPPHLKPGLIQTILNHSGEIVPTG